jgi:hypothetical protein
MAKNYQLTRKYRDLTEDEKAYIKNKGYSTLARLLDVSVETLRRSVVYGAHMNEEYYKKIFNASIETKTSNQ